MTVKECPKCHTEKAIEEFGKANNTCDGYSSHCKVCRRDYQKSYAAKRERLGVCVVNGCSETAKQGCKRCEKHLEYSRQYSRNRRDTLKANGLCPVCGKLARPGYSLCFECNQKIKDQKKRAAFSQRVGNYYNNECAICHEVSEHYEVFDCHHIDPLTKRYKISNMVHLRWELVIKEMEKCVYLCANCHRRQQGERFAKEIIDNLRPGKPANRSSNVIQLKAM
jgi:hypothetical protein